MASRNFTNGLRSNLIAGARAFFGRRPQPGSIVSTLEQVVALLAIVLVLAGVLDKVSAPEDAEFAYWGVYSWFALLLMGLWVCALAARTLSERADTRTVLVAALATAPWALVLIWLVSLVPSLAQHGRIFDAALIAIAIYAMIMAARAAYGFLRTSTFVAIALCVVGVVLASNVLDLDVRLWDEPAEEESEGTEASAQDAESIFFAQSGLIDEAVEKMQPQRPGVTDLYYLGFAGDGYQRVFRREALLGESVFAERLGTAPRSLELINDYEDRTGYPLATVVGLRYALSVLGMSMDPSEDVLVLLLTSHGSQEGGISIRDGVIPVDNDLPPDDLRRALDDAGIKWRIIIVSACYSGVFIEPLKSDTTMILTAADSQHTSFGCADDRELTYFGEAFLRDSLPTAPSLAAAFEHARREIAEREKQEKLTPSNPQIWVGASMARKLNGLGTLPLRATDTPESGVRHGRVK